MAFLPCFSVGILFISNGTGYFENGGDGVSFPVGQLSVTVSTMADYITMKPLPLFNVCVILMHIQRGKACSGDTDIKYQLFLL